MRYPKAFQSLIDNFSSLPSIGPKLAERLVLYLFRQEPEQLERFAESLEAIRHLKSCTRCFHIAENELCEICSDPQRDTATLCVVEEPLDVIALERSGGYTGRYHILGGVLSVGKNDNSDTLHIRELLGRIPAEHVTEVILATNPTTEGDMTALYLKKKLEPFTITITRIGRGLATGGDIEYADDLTLRSALTNRQHFN